MNVFGVNGCCGRGASRFYKAERIPLGMDNILPDAKASIEGADETGRVQVALSADIGGTSKRGSGALHLRGTEYDIFSFCWLTRPCPPHVCAHICRAPMGLWVRT